MAQEPKKQEVEDITGAVEYIYNTAKGKVVDKISDAKDAAKDTAIAVKDKAVTYVKDKSSKAVTYVKESWSANPIATGGTIAVSIAALYILFGPSDESKTQGITLIPMENTQLAPITLDSDTTRKTTIQYKLPSNALFTVEEITNKGQAR